MPAGAHYCVLQLDKAFPRLAHSSGKTHRMFMKILSELYHWKERPPLNFERHPDQDSGFGPDPPWRGSAPSEYSFCDFQYSLCVWYFLMFYVLYFFIFFTSCIPWS